jgi:hypothetical protein
LSKYSARHPVTWRHSDSDASPNAAVMLGNGQTRHVVQIFHFCLGRPLGNSFPRTRRRRTNLGLCLIGRQRSQAAEKRRVLPTFTLHTRGEDRRFKKIALAAGAAAIRTSGAMAADYYVVQEKPPRSAGRRDAAVSD